jgi:His Kinase A (phosphoacceptor) domain.
MQKNFLEKIRSSARILLGVINDILDFSKIEQDKLNLNIAPFSLHSMIQTVMDLFSSQASLKNLDFVLEQDENIPTL